MQDKDETTTKCKISELYVSNDMEAFQIDRHLTIQRKLQAKDPTNKEVVKNLANELKLHQHDSLAKIILTNSQNTYPFSDDAISTAISTEIFEVLEIEAESEEISINVVCGMERAGDVVAKASDGDGGVDGSGRGHWVYKWRVRVFLGGGVLRARGRHWREQNASP